MMMKSLIVVATLFFASPAFAAFAPSLGSAGSYGILAGTAVTCTSAVVLGDVGIHPGTAVTHTNCTITGAIKRGDAARRAQQDFLLAYTILDTPCDTGDTILTGTLAGETLGPGTYCFEAAAALTGTLTLDGGGNPDAVWIFKVGTGGTGALTGTNFTVHMINGGDPCNVYWWVAEAATLTDSTFMGTILAGAAITVTAGTFSGNALTQSAVTITGAVLTSCAQVTTPPPPPHPQPNAGCNQGVGNGPEGCDPGNSNQGNPARSNDERGGTPGNPGRKGGR
jgi:hypothetical protein